MDGCIWSDLAPDKKGKRTLLLDEGRRRRSGWQEPRHSVTYAVPAALWRDWRSEDGS